MAAIELGEDNFRIGATKACICEPLSRPYRQRKTNELSNALTAVFVNVLLRGC